MRAELKAEGGRSKKDIAAAIQAGSSVLHQRSLCDCDRLGARSMDASGRPDRQAVRTLRRTERARHDSHVGLYPRRYVLHCKRRGRQRSAALNSPSRHLDDHAGQADARHRRRDEVPGVQIAGQHRRREPHVYERGDARAVRFGGVPGCRQPVRNALSYVCRRRCRHGGAHRYVPAGHLQLCAVLPREQRAFAVCAQRRKPGLRWAV